MSLNINLDATTEVNSLETFTVFGNGTVVVGWGPFEDKYAVKLRYPKASAGKPGEAPEQGTEYYDVTHTLLFPAELQAKKVAKALTNNYGKGFVRKL